MAQQLSGELYNTTTTRLEEGRYVKSQQDENMKESVAMSLGMEEPGRKGEKDVPVIQCRNKGVKGQRQEGCEETSASL